MIKADYLVIGSGIAGLSFALKACKIGTVSLITKKKLFDSATGKAQGGIACVIDKDDTFDEHIQDTLVAGDGLCNKKIVDIAVKSAPDRIKELINMGMNFGMGDLVNRAFIPGQIPGQFVNPVIGLGQMPYK